MIGPILFLRCGIYIKYIVSYRSSVYNLLTCPSHCLHPFLQLILHHLLLSHAIPFLIPWWEWYSWLSFENIMASTIRINICLFYNLVLISSFLLLHLSATVPFWSWRIKSRTLRVTEMHFLNDAWPQHNRKSNRSDYSESFQRPNPWELLGSHNYNVILSRSWLENKVSQLSEQQKLNILAI